MASMLGLFSKGEAAPEAVEQLRRAVERLSTRCALLLHSRRCVVEAKAHSLCRARCGSSSQGCG